MAVFFTSAPPQQIRATTILLDAIKGAREELDYIKELPVINITVRSEVISMLVEYIEWLLVQYRDELVKRKDYGK